MLDTSGALSPRADLGIPEAPLCAHYIRDSIALPAPQLGTSQIWCLYNLQPHRCHLGLHLNRGCRWGEPLPAGAAPKDLSPVCF